jgi:hypothetical protein
MQTAPIERVPGEMSPEQQVDEWVKGNAIHNNNRYYRIVGDDGAILEVRKMDGGECCPDFSCCQPELMWSEELRLKFKNSNEHVRGEMLGMALDQLLSHAVPDVKCTVLTDGTDSKSIN